MLDLDTDPSARAKPGPCSYGQQVPAVDQATRVLFHLGQAPPEQANLTAICRAAGIHYSKGHAILNTLRAAGLVTRNEASKTYSLGPAVLTLSRCLLDRTDLAQAAEPLLAELADASGATALLGTITADHVYVVARREAPAGIAVSIRVGHRYPLTWGAHGKAIVAHLAEAERDKVLAAGPLHFQGDPTDLCDLGAVRQELAEVRRLGYAVDLGAVQTGISAVSAPLLTGRGEPAAAVILVGTFPPEDAAALGRRVAATAREMSQRLGPYLGGAG
ncbi:MAG: IclR family transcriptional regulator [Thermoleophilia bacterium]|nr:IclR family transcriptional regulator [Thermoleophilia bacterium]